MREFVLQRVVPAHMRAPSSYFLLRLLYLARPPCGAGTIPRPWFRHPVPWKQVPLRSVSIACTPDARQAPDASVLLVNAWPIRAFHAAETTPPFSPVLVVLAHPITSPTEAAQGAVAEVGRRACRAGDARRSRRTLIRPFEARWCAIKSHVFFDRSGQLFSSSWVLGWVGGGTLIQPIGGNFLDLPISADQACFRDHRHPACKPLLPDLRVFPVYLSPSLAPSVPMPPPHVPRGTPG